MRRNVRLSKALFLPQVCGDRQRATAIRAPSGVCLRTSLERLAATSGSRDASKAEGCPDPAHSPSQIRTCPGARAPGCTAISHAPPPISSHPRGISGNLHSRRAGGPQRSPPRRSTGFPRSILFLGSESARVPRRRSGRSPFRCPPEHPLHAGLRENTATQGPVPERQLRARLRENATAQGLVPERQSCVGLSKNAAPRRGQAAAIPLQRVAGKRCASAAFARAASALSTTTRPVSPQGSENDTAVREFSLQSLRARPS